MRRSFPARPTSYLGGTRLVMRGGGGRRWPALLALCWRGVWRAGGSGALWLPVLFFLRVATAVPFAGGPDAPRWRRAGGGMLWVAALLAALLPIDRLVRPDKEAGVLDQLAVRGFADEVVAAVKIAAHEIGRAHV